MAHPSTLYPEIEPYAHGLLDVGGGDLLYWEVCGNPRGKPAIVLHGGPGSGCTPWHRRLFDPAGYRVVLFDQRNCGRSKPHASDPEIDLVGNTTAHLIADIELLREHLGIERWLMLGGSWGSTLALAYAEQFLNRVSEMILFGVTTGRHAEFDWFFRGGLAEAFPHQWQRLTDYASAGLTRTSVPLTLPARHGGRLTKGRRQRPSSPGQSIDLPEAYNRVLLDPDPAVHQPAALEWCLWESATPDWPPSDALAERFADPAYALAFARIVTHYVTHNAWLEDGILLRNAGKLADIPGVLINGRHDVQSPLSNAQALQQAWPSADLIIVEDAGHNATKGAITRELVRAADRFAGQ